MVCGKSGTMKRSYFKYIFALLLFGSNGIVASFISMDSYEIVLLRTLIGSLLLIAIFFAGKGKLTFYKKGKQFSFLCVSGMAMGASWLLLYEAYTQIGVGISSLLYYCGPVLVMALSPILFREKFGASKMIGLACVLGGICLVNGKVFGGGANSVGFVWGILSAVMYAVMVICNKKAADIAGLENAMLQLFISFLTVAAFVVLKQGFAIQIAPANILPIFILGLLNTGAGCYFYFSSICDLPIQTVAICGYLEPLSAVLFSVVMLQESMSLLQVLGAALMIGGAIFAECCNFRRRVG